ncbi:MAG: cytochrome-c oxidase, cbb3-type subunit III [Paraglaciecola sp.]|uniref:cytochrome-c oxidase, cbb3-type subunit III n=1 Tax=Pseudomonadati TaxID=3379134 RepID=UPI00273F2F81|nr:cytochrome-c oxidase, cbb3-type subunit III [Paraglaciecola sp.]MDP5029445.1 cytochrome-c oxidase, cbb3-type subunit III [Paraglaciecola sp.]MDP5133032.1 cytochrome-c oxidase, cbb3-type subunit III [Paraglaciecola sp.]
MSSFWSIWISVITLGSILGCFLLLRWCLSNKTGVKEGDDMHHEFDGILEINNQLPRWWTILFYICIVWALLYLLLYPGLGNFKGLWNWQSSNQGILSLAESRAAVEKNKADGVISQYDREVDQANELFQPIFDGYYARPITELAKDAEALKVGQRLFSQNCSQCHGSDARGQRGFPNLTDNDWLYGGTPEKITETLINGRNAIMPAWFDSMGADGIEEVVNYVLGLSGRKVDESLAAKGKDRFVACAACHGPDGKGNQAFGAPNLTDDIWLYGNSHEKVTETLTYGRNGVMPAFKNTLGEKKIHLVAAYVYSLSQDK